ncbi:hypothetical protein F0562_024816 [Nyssa sinensis]|uniref:Uncharacterized protein n=1 Tax=Nyssa sinensis TaxID=561372 RepID=A0A5J5BCR5_9ASTE|nr:hypothetical protein F0562_024816 [Nyssa sinensis]
MGSAPLCGSGGLDLDLNQIDEASDMVQYLNSGNRKLEAPLLPVKSTSAGRFPNCEHGRSSMQFQPPVAGLRLNDAEIRNVSSWLSPGNTYSAVAIPSILPDRGDQPCPIVATGGPQRILAPHTAGTPFTPDVYRGSVLSSSPAVPFTSSPFHVFPFRTGFSLPSASFSGGSTTYMDSSSGGRLCFPAVNSQLLGPAGAVSSQYPRPFVVSLSDGCNNVGGENSKKWGRHGLDLNAGPGGLDIEGRDETLPLALRQHSVASSQALTEEQARMYQSGNPFKACSEDGQWLTPGSCHLTGVLAEDGW